jgi:hypothetical protein
MVHTCNPCTQEIEVVDHEFQANLDYISQPCLKNKNKSNGVEHT